MPCGRESPVSGAGMQLMLLLSSSQSGWKGLGCRQSEASGYVPAGAERVEPHHPLRFPPFMARLPWLLLLYVSCAGEPKDQAGRCPCVDERCHLYHDYPLFQVDREEERDLFSLI